ncbi:hypothetical protein, partial [Bacillus sp. MMSF_3328]
MKTIFNWLETNYLSIRAVLEIIYFISASFVPIILGYITIKYTKEVNKREEYNKRILESSHKLHPRIIVSAQESTLQTELSHEVLNIYKEQNISLKKVNLEYESYIELFVNSSEYKKVFIPVLGYYGVRSGNLLQGNQVILYPYKPNRKFFVELYRSFNSVSQKEQPSLYVNPEIKTYLKISYTNSLDDDYIDHYVADQAGYFMLTEQENIKLQENLNLMHAIDFYKLDAEFLWSKFKEIN